MSETRFLDRHAAGHQLAVLLAGVVDARPAARSLVVLGLPRGGVPVAAEVARLLGAPLDVLPVRKLGVPGNQEFAVGAIAAVNTDLIEVKDEVLLRRYPDVAAQLGAVLQEAHGELRRQQRLYQGTRPVRSLEDCDVILVDDGIATGATMRAAVRAARHARAHRVIAAAPVGATQSCALLRTEADACVCAAEPSELLAVGMWYGDFSPTPNREVLALLEESDRRRQHQLTAT